MMSSVYDLLNLIVLTRPKLKGVMYVYLLGLAVSNLCVLIIAIPALIAITSPQCSRAYAKAYFQVINIDYIYKKLLFKPFLEQNTFFRFL